MTVHHGSRDSSCAGKERFADKVLAEKICRRSRQSHDTVTLMVYRCQHCHGWHLGERLAGKKIEQRVRQAKRAEF